MAQKKAGGSSKNGRDSNSKRLGIKVFNNNYVNKGSIIIKQNGLKFNSGKNTFFSNNYCIHSLINGIVKIYKKNKKKIVEVNNVY
ncbi:ribosomal protein L27 [Candidatus Carsonella ruddii HT isolate Thao2000]|uniref:Large ribosomal subunit protein bL27 n=1 Tax=Candidatus Carsonella ruddii HT isolate Thao2000 TaxID=1202539 RepID=J3Z1N6_CARRU|nr:50S ribosomal protein L27 [Candidatus Carsonella ruddii]AFP84179.1 ribosomal protein L27 [Candidatus Carsonella ruddii HT isolate Thao2000]